MTVSVNYYLDKYKLKLKSDWQLIEISSRQKSDTATDDGSELRTTLKDL